MTENIENLMRLLPYRQSICVIREIIEARMYPIIVEGLERAMSSARRRAYALTRLAPRSPAAAAIGSDRQWTRCAPAPSPCR